ncbi:uncharacterized protein FIBRA_03937 [Fibroporia radiculosa]|uniref:Helicase ATP-binding domain-containing protein n=1 Tax=Fibroporia radiculosa TaxID=599839 RepID=J4I9W4_9APHY|nr:uncharacterized protein FIBRA_03937 [Fibroporia radiculosa]CCM01866.1 predicted protein [Fibroporia radiculosa]
MPLSATEVAISAELTKLRESPLAIPSEATLKLLSDHLLGRPHTTNVFSRPFTHWFCVRADAITRETAAFLIRLHAYNDQSNSVKLWRQQFRACLAGCCECVKGFQEAKVTTRHTYFGAFSDSTLQRFYESLDGWEVESVLAALSEVHIAPSDSRSGFERSLSMAPPAVVYHIFTNLRIMGDPSVVNVLHTFPPNTSITEWPSDCPPPGLFYALLAEQPEVRAWAESQISSYQLTPMPAKGFLREHRAILESVSKVVSTRTTSGAAGGETPFPLVDEANILWSNFLLILRLIPVPFLRPGKSYDLDIRHLVIGHLHDSGTHFVDVLKCFLLLVNRLGSSMWEAEVVDFPQIVFNSIKDNPRYLESLQNLGVVRKDNWYLNWIEAFVKTVADMVVFKEILPIVTHFLVEELQHERFQELRPAAMTIALRVLLAVLDHADEENMPLERILVQEIMDVHTGIFVSVSYARKFMDDKWAEARALTRKLLARSLTEDIKSISSAIVALSRSTADPSQLPALHIREQIWKQLYDTIQPSDQEGISEIIAALAQIAHIDDLKDSIFADRIGKSPHRQKYKDLIDGVNQALAMVRDGFNNVVTRFIDLSLPSVMIELFRRSGVVRNIIMLMLSPAEPIQEAAQALVGSAYDVEVRMDCFRAALENSPDAALNGICDMLGTFTRHAQVVPEACSLSKALARCLTDIIDVLCSGPDGLLHKQAFLTTGLGDTIPSQLPKWWSLMTNALSVIFSRTPRWAIFFDNADMVLWMRDALIFGRDMLAQRRVIESATLVIGQRPDDSRNKLSRVGKKMVEDLQSVVFELTRWLRLTDEELLHQSFSLLESLLKCFQETSTPPKKEALQKIQKHIDDGRKNDPNRPQTRLDAARLARLEDAISVFEDDDEIQIISHQIPEVKIRGSSGKERASIGLVHKPSVGAERQSKEIQRTRFLTKNTSISNYFTSKDQQKLVSESAFPKLGKNQSTAVVSVQKPTVSVKDERPSTRPTTEESGSEREESDDDEPDTGLAELSKLQRTPVVKKPVERRQVMRLDAPTTIRNSALTRVQNREDARRTQMRLKPDISGLHKTLLSWNYDHEGPNPPGNPIKLAAVPDRFTDVHHFRNIMEPLLLLECWTQLIESKEEAQETYECHIGSRQFVDEWAEIEASITQIVKRDWNLSDADVVLLRHPASRQPALGKVQNYRASPMGIQVTIRCLARGGDPGLQPNTVWLLSKVLNLTTLHREYGALMALPYYDSCDTVLRANLSLPSPSDSREVQTTMKAYSVNEPQAKAILYSLKADGFALIQGPPGTGKTSTICGLVHAFLSRRPKPATLVAVGRTTNMPNKEPVKKVLLCAPSNAAIDEIAFRLKEGVSGAGTQPVSPKVVRVGTTASMKAVVKDISLEHLIEQKINANPSIGGSADSGSDIMRLRAELESVKTLRQQKLDEISNIHDNAAKTLSLEEEVKRLNKQRFALTQQFDKLKDKQKSDSRTMDATRRRFRTEVLLEADVVCSTLSGAAYEYLEQLDFELIVIDEAAQAIELSSLIPLKYRCRRCIMVGDPQQLPPTVKSQEACKFGYNQSLFVRFQRQRPEAVHLLSIQYRMHPDISLVPSQLFYDRKLQDGPDMATKTKRPWHSNEKLGTYHFFDVAGGREEAGRNHSFINRAECQVAIALFNRLRREYSTFDFDYKVGIVSMYRGQIFELRRMFEQRFGADISSIVDFHTVDGFQGQEKDVIILSCVRAGPNVQTVGFLRDMRRMNVALTRAKSSLFVLGHAATLERSDGTWRQIISDARERSRLVNVDVSYFTTPTNATRPAHVPTKAPKPQSKKLPPLPPGLMPVHELNSRTDNTEPETTRPSGDQAQIVPNLTEDAVRAGLPQLGETSVGQKRPAPDDDLRQSAQASTNQQANRQDRPRPPPKKRPKPAPSLFIPKNRRAPQ